MATNRIEEQEHSYHREYILGGRRYVVCRNRAEAEKDAADREAIAETDRP